MNNANGEGIDLCEWLQRTIEFAPPVILVTRSSRSSLRVRGLDAGAVDVIPFTCGLAESPLASARRIRGKLHIDALLDRAATDSLTGLWNRRYVDVRLGELIAAAQRHDRAFACILFDVDAFKAVNDALGHAAGDAVLAELARRITSAIRESDMAFRIGGEEFLVVAPDTRAAPAIDLAERIRLQIGGYPIRLPTAIEPGPAELTVTASVGVAAWHAGISAAQLLRRADAAMYAAKQRGKNRVVADTDLGRTILQKLDRAAPGVG